METYLRGAALASLLARQANPDLRRRGARLWYSQRKPFCDAPVSVALGARGQRSAGLSREDGKAVWLDLWVPCRKCEKCAIVRRIQWRKRIVTEITEHTRNLLS